MVKYDIEAIYQLINLKEKDNLELEIGVMDNQIYEEQFFDFIDNAGDGNCFFRTISQFINGNENLHKNLRDQVYNYVSNNITNFYEYCYVENNTYYIDIEENSQIKKFVLDDYVANIKKIRYFQDLLKLMLCL